MRVGLLALVLVVGSVASVMGDDALILDPDEDRIVGEPDVAIAGDGSMVVAWSSRVIEGAQPLNGIRVRRFGPDGRAVGSVFRIDVLPGDLARKPSVDITPDGSRVVVVWEGGTEGKRNKRRIWVQVFDSGALPVGEEIRVDQIRMTHEQWGLPRDYYRDPKVSIAPNGDFVVVWRSEGKTSCDRFNISARRFSSNGEPLGDEFIVNTERPWSQLNPDVDHDASGGFVVIWQSGRWIGTSDEISTIQGRIFRSSGEAIGEEIRLSPESGRSAAALPSLSVAPGGGFACAWKGGNGADGMTRIAARRYDRTGNAVEAPNVIEPASAGHGGPEIEFLERGNLLVAWTGKTEDGFKSPAVVSLVFDANGQAVSDIFPLSPATCWEVSSFSVAGAARGDGAVVWLSELDDGIIARRFSGAEPWLDVPLTSGGTRFTDLVSANRRILADSEAESSARQNAARFLFCMGGAASSAEDTLRHCVANSGSRFSDPVRKECVFALASVAASPEHAIPILLRILESEEEPNLVRGAAACAIGLYGDEGRPAVPSLMAALDDESALVVGCAGRSLGDIGAHEAVAPMVTALLEREPNGDPREMHGLLISGLAKLSRDERAVRALDRYIRACYLLATYVKETNSSGYLLSLERFIKHRLHKRKENDRRMIAWTVDEALSRLEKGWVNVWGFGRQLRSGEDYDRVDYLLTEYVAMRNLGGTTVCDAAVALARAIADLDRMPEWASEMYSSLLWGRESLGCIGELLGIAEGMGRKAAPIAGGISVSFGSLESPRIDAIQALAATDPGCEKCVPRLVRSLNSAEDVVARVEIIRALMAAGPTVIRQLEPELTLLLEDESSMLRLQAERALDLIEADAEVCDGNWVPPAVETRPEPLLKRVPGNVVGWSPKRPPRDHGDIPPP